MEIATGRYSQHCLACGAAGPAREWSATSAFFARRAMLRAPGVVPLLHCLACGTRYFDVIVTDADLARLYADYRGEEYFALRHGFEPWYTRAVNDGLGAEEAMRARRAVLREALAESGVDQNFAAVLDHGGDRGQMLLDLQAPLRAVYEISGATPEPGVVTVDSETVKSRRWDLVLSCHVLEHLADPAVYIAELVSLGHEKTVYFFEVPNELFRSFKPNQWGLQKLWLKIVVKWPPFFKLMNFISAGVLYRMGMILPLLFSPMHEHLTFFTVPGMTQILERHGLRVKTNRVYRTGHIGVVAMKDVQGG